MLRLTEEEKKKVITSIEFANLQATAAFLTSIYMFRNIMNLWQLPLQSGGTNKRRRRRRTMRRPQGVVTMETIHRFKVLPITDIFPQSLMFVKTNRASSWCGKPLRVWLEMAWDSWLRRWSDGGPPCPAVIGWRHGWVGGWRAVKA